MSTEQNIEAAVMCVLLENFREELTMQQIKLAAYESARLAMATIGSPIGEADKASDVSEPVNPNPSQDSMRGQEKGGA